MWAGRIISTNSSIIVAGNAHINNEYGLQDMLEARGIELKIVKEFDNEIKKYKILESEREKIRQEAKLKQPIL